MDTFVFRLRIAGVVAESPEVEVARLLERVADKVEDGETSGPLVDVNGNTVGTWGFQ